MSFTWRSTQVAADTSNATQDITISGIGTPKIVIFEATYVTSVGTGVDHGGYSWGATDGTDQYNFAQRTEDAVAATDTSRFTGADGCILFIAPTDGSLTGQGSFNSFITDGIRINWDTNPPSAYAMTVTFIYGTDDVALVNYITANTENLEEDIDGLSFAPNVVLGWWARASLSQDPSASAVNLFLHHGVACNNEGTIEQWASSVADRDNRADSGWAYAVRDDCLFNDVTQGTTGLRTFGARLRVTAFLSDGITVQTVNGTVTFNIVLILASTGTARVTAKMVDVETSVLGTGAAKKITASSTSGDWKPKLVRIAGVSV